MKYDEFSKKMSSSVSLKESEFAEIKNHLIEKFLSEYEGERIEWPIKVIYIFLII